LYGDRGTHCMATVIPVVWRPPYACLGIAKGVGAQG